MELYFCILGGRKSFYSPKHLQPILRRWLVSRATNPSSQKKTLLILSIYRFAIRNISWKHFLLADKLTFLNKSWLYPKQEKAPISGNPSFPLDLYVYELWPEPASWTSEFLSAYQPNLFSPLFIPSLKNMDSTLACKLRLLLLLLLLLLPLIFSCVFGRVIDPARSLLLFPFCRADSWTSSTSRRLWCVPKLRANCRRAKRENYIPYV